MTNAVQQLSAEQIETQQLSAAASAIFRRPIEKFPAKKTLKRYTKTTKKSKSRRQRSGVTRTRH